MEQARANSSTAGELSYEVYPQTAEAVGFVCGILVRLDSLGDSFGLILWLDSLGCCALRFAKLRAAKEEGFFGLILWFDSPR